MDVYFTTKAEAEAEADVQFITTTDADADADVKKCADVLHMRISDTSLMQIYSILVGFLQSSLNSSIL